MNNLSDSRKRMLNYGNMSRKNSINSREETNSNYNIINHLSARNNRNISEIRQIVQKSTVDDKKSIIYKIPSGKFNDTSNEKKFYNISNKLNKDNIQESSQKFRVQTSKVSFSSKNKYDYDDIQESISNKPNISYSFNNYQKYYLSCIGLENLGNTCYMNTSLQCLIHSANFISKFINEISSLNLKNDCTAKHFYNLLNKILSNTKSISPSDFKSFFSKKHRLFSGYSQHDCQEFLRHMLEDISLDMNRVKNIPAYKELETKKKSKLQINDEFHKLFLKREDSVVLDVFQGQFCNTFECENCEFRTYSFEKFIDIPILLEATTIRSSLNLENLLDKHFKDDRFEWSSKCESCQKKTFHTKKTRISILPDIFVISFQRYNHLNNRKNNVRISFPEDLNILSYVDLECANTKKNEFKYNLYAISNHSGSLNFGHYYAYCKINGDWKEFNDSLVTNIGSVSTNSETVYVLFYEKRH